MDDATTERNRRRHLVLLTAVSLPWRAELPEGLLDREAETRGRDLRIQLDGHVIDTHRFLSPFLSNSAETIQEHGIAALRVSVTAFGFAGFSATAIRGDQSPGALDEPFRALVRDRLSQLNDPPSDISVVKSDFPKIQSEIPWIHRVEFNSDERQQESLTVGVGESFGIINGSDLAEDNSTISRWMDVLTLGLCFWSQQEALDSEVFVRIAHMGNKQETFSSLSNDASWIEAVTTVPLAMTSIEQNLPRDLQVIWLDAMKAWRIPGLLTAVQEKVALYKSVIESRRAKLRENRGKIANLILAVIGASTLGAFLESLVNQATNDGGFGIEETHPGRWLLITTIILVVAFGVRQIIKREADSSSD